MFPACEEMPQVSSNCSSAGASPEDKPQAHSTCYMVGACSHNSVSKTNTSPMDSQTPSNPSTLFPAGRDPFINTNGQKGQQKLSPTASTFQPFGLSIQGIAAAPVVVSSPIIEPRKTSMSTPKKSRTPSSPTGSHSSFNTSQTGVFSTDTVVTRALKISGIYGSVSRDQVEDCIKVCG